MESQLTKSNMVIENTNLTPIEIALGVDENGMTTAKRLYEFLGLDKKNYARWCKSKIDDNEFALENVDYMPFVINEECGGQATIDYKLTASFAKKLAMGTHNEKGEAAKNYFVKVEDRLKKQNIAVNELSPSLQMFAKIFDSVAQQELEHKQLKKEVAEAKEETAAVKKEIENIREVVEIKPSENWRAEVNALMKKICFKLNDYKTPKEESYKALKERASCDLKVRLKNMRGRLALEGATKTKIDNLNYLDVIKEDKKLIEIYTAVVKGMAIKYKVA